LVDDFDAEDGRADSSPEESKISSNGQPQNLFQKRSIDRNSFGSNNAFTKKSRNNVGSNQRYYKQDDDLMDVIEDGEG